MTPLVIQESKNTPQVNWDVEQDEFLVVGKSYPENASKFYSHLVDWIKEMEFSAPAKFSFYFYYINSSSIIAIFQLIKVMESCQKDGRDLSIEWRYDEEDEDIEKIGRDFMKLTTVPFSFVKLDE